MIQGQFVVHYVTYPQSPQQVWRALVDPEELALWRMPNDFVPQVGRQFTMECDQPVGRIHGEVLEVEPERRLSCRWVGQLGDTVVTFELTPTATAVDRHTGGRAHDDMALLLLEHGASARSSANGHPATIPTAAAA